MLRQVVPIGQFRGPELRLVAQVSRGPAWLWLSRNGTPTITVVKLCAADESQTHGRTGAPVGIATLLLQQLRCEWQGNREDCSALLARTRVQGANGSPQPILHLGPDPVQDHHDGTQDSGMCCTLLLKTTAVSYSRHQDVLKQQLVRRVLPD